MPDQDWRVVRFGRQCRAWQTRAPVSTDTLFGIERWVREVIRHGPSGIPVTADQFFDWVDDTNDVFVVFTVVEYEELVVINNIY